MTQICIASQHPSLAAACASPELRRLVREPGFLIELRLDTYADLTPTALAEALQLFGPQACVVTFRSANEGGQPHPAAIPQRFAYLQQARAAGAAFVDVELAMLQAHPTTWRALQAVPTDTSQLIVSHHDFANPMPLAELQTVRRAAEQAGADLVKIAYVAPTASASWPLLRLLQETDWTMPVLGIAMGEAGLWSRVLNPLFAKPSPFVFARGTEVSGTAPGQPTWEALLNMYRVGTMTADTPVYGVMGAPIAHSLSPLMHNAALAHCGLPGVYVPFWVPDDAAQFVTQFAEPLRVRGLSVTIPHKEAVRALCQRIDAVAQAAGAINTLQATAVGWAGSNTDASAAADCLAQALQVPLRGANVVILGAGGAARAAACALIERGAQVLICNRHLARAQALAQAIGGSAVDRPQLVHLQDVAAIINATPVGMWPHIDTSPLSAAEFPPHALAFDMIYRPRQTQFLADAQQHGHRTLDGLAMFVAQGAAQFTRFTGHAAPIEHMRQVVLAALERAVD